MNMICGPTGPRITTEKKESAVGEIRDLGYPMGSSRGLLSPSNDRTPNIASRESNVNPPLSSLFSLIYQVPGSGGACP